MKDKKPYDRVYYERVLDLDRRAAIDGVCQGAEILYNRRAQATGIFTCLNDEDAVNNEI